MSLSRRQFLTSAGIGVAVIGSAEAFFSAPNALGAPPGTPGYGPLVADPAGRLALPKGFTYQIVAEAGKTKLDTGEVTPSKFDGTGAFKDAAGGTVLVLNHEIGSQFASEKLAVPHTSGLVYDNGAAGGCTIVTVDKDNERFSAEPQIIIGDPPEGLDVEMFIAMDPPRHAAQRKAVAPAFSPERLQHLAPLVEHALRRDVGLS